MALSRFLWAPACALLTVGCAPQGYQYETGSFVARPINYSAASPSTEVSQVVLDPKQISLILGSNNPPPTADCSSWKRISSAVFQVSRANGNVARNDLVGEVIREAKRRGWTEDAAKQLLVILVGVSEDPSMSEDGFVREQYSKCSENASSTNSNRRNVNISLYDSKQNAQSEGHPDQRQAEIANQQKLLQPCLSYRSQASLVPVFKAKGYSLAQTQEYFASKAYSPSGIAYRDSKQSEAVLTALARAGYESDPTTWRDRQGKQTKDFAEYAFSRCMSGEIF